MLGSQVHPRRPPGALGRQRPVAARCPLPPPRTQAWPGWRWGWRQCPGLDSGTASSLPRRGNQGTAQRGARGYWSAAALPSPALVTARPPPWLVLARATDTLTAEPGSARSLCPSADAWDSKCGGGGARARPTETAGAEGRWGRGCWPQAAAGHTGCWRCPSRPECATVSPGRSLWGIMDSSAGDTWPCCRPDTGPSTAPTQVWITACILRTQF